MRRIFCHINEMGPDAWAVLPALMVLADEVVLWSPAATALEKAVSEPTLESVRPPFTPKDILSLVEDGCIKIAARRWFVEDARRRNSPAAWPGQYWHREFDEALLSILRTEERTRPANRRIIIADSDTGYEKADAAIRRPSEAFHLARKLLQQNRLPLGTAERIKRNRLSDDPGWKRRPSLMAIREILRDAYNHEEARDTTKSDIPIYLAPFPIDEFNRIAHAKNVSLRDIDIDRSDIVEFFKWIGSLPFASDVQSIKKLRKDSDQRKLFWDLLQTTRSVGGPT